jgi:hypothetical protein
LTEAAVAQAFEELLGCMIASLVRIEIPELPGKLFLDRFNTHSQTAFLLEYAPSVGAEASYIQKAVAQGRLETKAIIFRSAEGSDGSRGDDVLFKKVIPYLHKLFESFGWQIEYQPLINYANSNVA